MGTLDLLKKFVATTPKETDGTDALTRAIEIGEGAAGEIAGEIEALAAQRAGLLVNGSDDELDKVDDALAARRRSADRTQARLGELRRCLEVAKAREQRETLDRTFARAQHHHDRQLEVGKRFDKVARQLRELALELAAHERERSACNAMLAQHGDKREVESGEVALDTNPTARIAQTVGTLLKIPNICASGSYLHPLTDHAARDEYRALVAAVDERVRQAAGA